MLDRHESLNLTDRSLNFLDRCHYLLLCVCTSSPGLRIIWQAAYKISSIGGVSKSSLHGDNAPTGNHVEPESVDFRNKAHIVF